MDVDIQDNTIVNTQIEKWVNLINSNNPEEMLIGTTELRKMISVEVSPPYNQVLASGVLPRLITFLDPSAPSQLQFETAWAISNIASSDDERHTKDIIEHGALIPLIKLILSPNRDVSEQCIWAIGNIAGEPKFRDEVLNNNVMDILVEIGVKVTTLGILKRISWAISNLCRGTPPPALHKILPCINILKSMASFKDEEVVGDSIWAISYITGSSNEGIQCIVDSGIVSRVVELMVHTNQSIMVPALRTIGNIASGTNYQTQSLITFNALPNLVLLINHTKKMVRKEALWASSNLAAGTPTQLQKMIDYLFFPNILTILNNPRTDEETKREALWNIKNAVSNGTAAQIAYFVDTGFISTLAGVLKTCQFPSNASVAIDALDFILKAGDRIEKKDRSSFTSNPYVDICKSHSVAPVLMSLTVRFENKKGVDEIIQSCIPILSTYFKTEDSLSFINDLKLLSLNN